MQLRLRRFVFHLRVFARVVFQRLLAICEFAVVPLLLAGSLGLVIWVLWKSRAWLTLANTITNVALDRIQAENEIMRTIGQTIGGALVLTGLYFTAKNVFVSHRGQITERFSVALGNLADKDNLMKRLGGVQALESISKDSSREYWRVMELFFYFVRVATNAPDYESSGEKRPRSDIQQILDAIGRRSRSFGFGEKRRVDLAGARLEGANFREANLDGAIFVKADLRGAIFQMAFLDGADFSDANLEGANFNLASLRETNFYNARLDRTQFRGAGLESTSFAMASLSEASFEGTAIADVNFANASLKDTEFDDARLSRCHFFGSLLEEASFRNAKVIAPIELSQAQIEKARDFPRS